MLIGLLGDLHGRVFHGLAVLAQWQIVTGRPFDAIVQVGDLGAFPNPRLLDPATTRFAQEDPTELDFSRLLHADGRLAEALDDLRARFRRPIYFIRGNHDDTDWLHALPGRKPTGTVAVDPFDLFHHVADGTVLAVEDVTMAFLGGVEMAEPNRAALDKAAIMRLQQLGPAAVDLFVTHEPPMGVSVGFTTGQIQGSSEVLSLIETLQPTYHVAGHVHQPLGPRRYGTTRYLGLAVVVPPARRDSERRVQPGCLAILDSVAGTIEHCRADWLGTFTTRGFDMIQFVNQLLGRDAQG